MTPEQQEPGSRSVRVVNRADHTLSRRDIDPDALKVLYRLYRSRHTAYLVGGGVRDLLIGKEPKDFDVGTDATPNEIRRLFRNSRIIGRRFPLVHVYFRGGKVVEVSTFRSNVQNGDAGPLSRDDNWGTPEQDAWRRDLTINGLFYDIETFTVIDFVGGLDDLEGRIIRTIGDPAERLREDPVRMIRAIRHAARTGFRIEDETWRAICELHPLIAECAPARVLEEFLRELRGGAAAHSIRLLRESGILKVLAPDLDRFLDEVGEREPEVEKQFWHQVELLDQLAVTEGPAADAVCLSVVLGTPVYHEIERQEAASSDASRLDIGKVVRDVVSPVMAHLGVSRRNLERTFHVLLAGRRLRKAALAGRVTPTLQRKSYFGESWTFLRIVLESEGWERERIDNLLEANGEARRRPRRRRRRRRRSKSRGAE
jgi:poly(A) polymerase